MNPETPKPYNHQDHLFFQHGKDAHRKVAKVALNNSCCSFTTIDFNDFYDFPHFWAHGPWGPWGPIFPIFSKICKMVRDLSRSVPRVFRTPGNPLINLVHFIFNANCHFLKVSVIELPIVLPIALPILLPIALPIALPIVSPIGPIALSYCLLYQVLGRTGLV